MTDVLDRSRSATDTFERTELTLNGIRTVVLSAGQGDPVVFLHGGGTQTGFSWLLPLAARHRVIVPFHPGFGESDDDPTIDSMQDHVLHNLDVFDALKLDRFALAGHSFGGWMAAETALVLRSRLTRLALIAPSGLYAPELPAADLATLPGSELLPHLTARPDRIIPLLAKGAGLDDLVLRYRERTAVARVTWEHPSNHKLARWLHRISAPTLISWGEADRVRSSRFADLWAAPLRDARVRTYPGAGHLLLEEEEQAVADLGDFLADRF